jgi:hypothetical protein
LNFVKFLATKKGKTPMFFPFLFLLLLLDPGSGMRKNQDPGETSRIRNTVFNKLMDLRKLTQNKAESRRFQPDRKNYKIITMYQARYSNSL